MMIVVPIECVACARLMTYWTTRWVHLYIPMSRAGGRIKLSKCPCRSLDHHFPGRHRLLEFDGGGMVWRVGILVRLTQGMTLTARCEVRAVW